MLHVQVQVKGEMRQLEHEKGILEFGRGPQRGDVPRCFIPDDPHVSKDHMRIQERPNGKVHVVNLSKLNPIWLNELRVAPGAESELPLPLRVTLGMTTVVIESALPESAVMDALATIARPVRPVDALKDALRTFVHEDDPSPSETEAGWLETVIAVLRAPAGSPEFYALAAEAVVDLAGLDRGLVLLLHADAWEVAGRYARKEPLGREFSHTILQRVVRDRRTFYQSMAAASASVTSLAGLEAIVASPIFNAKEEVTGVVYGSRGGGAAKQDDIGSLEAKLVQLLAWATGTGLVRLEREAEANRLRVQFDQFFSPDLARELERNPSLLEGQEREVTILSSDIRGFSTFSQRLGPVDTCRLVRDVMDLLTEQVRATDGVIVDYSGDGMLAMWNAPTEQQDHALLACRAAVEALEDLPGLSKAWQSLLGAPLVIGIGLNTGTALVGNQGSRTKFKYGPLGHAVNLASRVEGATKQFGIPALITGTTRELLGNALPTRRLCRVRVVGISEPVDVYELYGKEASSEWCLRRDAYEKALAHYEAKQWADCCRHLSWLISDPDGSDIPSCLLLSRAVERLKSPAAAFDPVMDLTSK
jgi:adenylate cyclase